MSLDILKERFSGKPITSQYENEIKNKEKIIEKLEDETNNLSNQVINLENEKNNILQELNKARHFEDGAFSIKEKNYVNELQSKETHEAISKMIDKDLSNSYVRVEVICDREGFWLKPHCDIKEKLLSGLIFINNANESEDLGTDFYNEKLVKVKTVPYKNNYGYLFSSGPNTWHGMEKKEIIKERRCLQVNYVTFPTDWKVE